MTLDTNTLFLGNTRNTLIKLALDDIHNGRSVVFIDPTGTDKILNHIPESRQEDVIFFQPDYENPFAFNVLADREHPAKLVSTLLLTLKGIWGYDDLATPLIDQFVRAGISTLLEQPNTTLVHLKQLLTNEHPAHSVVLQEFWRDFENKDKKTRLQNIDSTLNKLWAFILDPLVLNSLVQPHNHMSFKDKIVLISLPQHLLGVENSSLLGALVLAQLYLSDATTNLYVNHAQFFGTAILSHILTIQKHVTCYLSLPYLDALPERHQNTLLSSSEAIFAARCSVKDAKRLEDLFLLTGTEIRLHELKDGSAYLVNQGTRTDEEVIAHNYPLTEKVAQKIIDRCRSQFTTPREVVQKRVEGLFGVVS